MKEKTKRKTYTSEFKHQAVELALHTGDIMQTARDLGVDHSSIRKWIRDIQENKEQAFPGSGNAKDKEVAELKRRLLNLEQETAILKKAVGIFAPRSR